MGNTLAEAIWRKSSYSGSNGGGCVDVAETCRNSRRPRLQNPDGPTLTFSRAEWRTFTTALDRRAGPSLTGRIGRGMARAPSKDRTAQQAKPADLVVVLPLKDWTCTGCGGTGDFLKMEDAGPVCLTCADMDDLIFLPSGDAALTGGPAKRAACRPSWCAGAGRVSAMSGRASWPRKPLSSRRKSSAWPMRMSGCAAGIGTGTAGPRRASSSRRAWPTRSDACFREGLSSEQPRSRSTRRCAAAAGWPVRGRPRPGRDSDHPGRRRLGTPEDTDYDRLLMSGIPREDARNRVRPVIDQVLDTWAN